jgi:CRISPR-associated endonuclease/helicase Cas3
MDEKIASALVNEVLKEKENKITNDITENQYNKEKIRQSWMDCNKKHYRETIRDIQSIEIVLVDLENYRNEKIIPWQYETISVYKWSFIGWAKQIEKNKIDDNDWVFGKAEQSNDSSFDDDWKEKDSYFMRRLPIEKMKNHFEVVFVDNRYFDYTQAGLMVSQDKNHKVSVSPIKQNSQKEKQVITYKKDTFYQHNKALLNCFEIEFKPYLKFVFAELEKYWENKIGWEKLIKIAICFHDYGKLNVAWQKPMKEFQKKKSGVDNPEEVLAHTDYDETTDKDLEKECKIKQKPSHAGIGAYQVYEFLYDTYLEEVARVVANAILKHHSPNTNSSANFSICKSGLSDMKKLINEYQIDGALMQKISKENDLGLMPTQDREWLLYLFMVRILRLCDQKATQFLEKYYTI